MRKNLIGTLAIVLWMSAGVSYSAIAISANYFVSTTGSDHNPGTLAKPFKTIQKCASLESVVCNIRGGRYFETVKPRNYVTIKNFKSEKVILDGRNKITNFKAVGGNRFVANVTLRDDDTNQIFFGEKSGTLAQWPNSDNPLKPNWETLQVGTTNSTLVNSNFPANLKGSGFIKFWSGEDAWSAETGAFQEVGRGKIEFKADSEPQDNWIVPQPGGLFYIFDNLSVLDTAFEWFYDSQAKKLYVQIPNGKSIRDYQIWYKSRDVGVDLSYVISTSIVGINLIANTVTSNQSSFGNEIRGVHASYVSQEYRLKDSPVHPWTGGFEVDHVFETGIMLRGQNNSLLDSVIDQSACNGVLVAGANNVIQNNSITNVGSIFNDCSGIYVVGQGHKIFNNSIHDCGRDAILLSFSWNAIDNPKSLSPRNIEIARNDLYNFGLLGYDVGGIYMNGQEDFGVVIHHNWIHDAYYPNPKPHSALVPHPTTVGIYIDGNTSQVEAYQNLLSNLELFPVLINFGPPTTHTGPNNNLIHNNTVINSSRGGSIQILGYKFDCGTTSFIDNNINVPLDDTTANTCKSSNNGLQAPGASEMPTTSVGCTLLECSLSPYARPE